MMLITPTTVTKGENMRTEIRNKVQKVRPGTKLAPEINNTKQTRERESEKTSLSINCNLQGQVIQSFFSFTTYTVSSIFYIPVLCT